MDEWWFRYRCCECKDDVWEKRRPPDASPNPDLRCSRCHSDRVIFEERIPVMFPLPGPK